MGCGPVEMIGDQDGFSKAMLSQVLQCIMAYTVGGNRAVLFLENVDLEDGTHLVTPGSLILDLSQWIYL